MNMMIFEQLQAMNVKLARMGVGDASGTSSSGDKGKLPSQPTNPHGEVKAIHTLRSDTQYAGPSMPEETVQPEGVSAIRQQACVPQDTPCGPQEAQQGISAGSSAAIGLETCGP
jgi:hypothetical protein